MGIEIVSGDLLDAFDKGEVNVIGHVVNCQGVMGSGIAKNIKERYPKVFEDYCKFIQDLGKSTFGCCSLTRFADKKHPFDKRIYNLYGQLDYGTHKRQLNYGAIGSALEDMSSHMSTDFDFIGFPYKMGSDRAGGDWNIVLEMIEFYFKGYDVMIYKLDK